MEVEAGRGQHYQVTQHKGLVLQEARQAPANGQFPRILADCTVAHRGLTKALYGVRLAEVYYATAVKTVASLLAYPIRLAEESQLGGWSEVAGKHTQKAEIHWLASSLGSRPTMFDTWLYQLSA